MQSAGEWARVIRYGGESAGHIIIGACLAKVKLGQYSGCSHGKISRGRDYWRCGIRLLSDGNQLGVGTSVTRGRSQKKTTPVT